MMDIADIDPSYISPWLILVLVVLFSILVLILIYFKMRNKTDVKAPPLEPVQWALVELNKISVNDWVNKGRIRELYVEWDRIIRTFIEKKHLSNALEKTGTELNLEFPFLSIFWAHSDRIKFTTDDLSFLNPPLIFKDAELLTDFLKR